MTSQVKPYPKDSLSVRFHSARVSVSCEGTYNIVSPQKLKSQTVEACTILQIAVPQYHIGQSATTTSTPTTPPPSLSKCPIDEYS